LTKGKYISPKSVNSQAVTSNNLHPAFSFKYLRKGYHLDDCTKDDKEKLIQRLVKLSGMSWSEIMSAHRHGFGHEKISRSSIKASIPEHITEDVSLLAFRFNGMKPMVGYRADKLFYILWLDYNFSLYPHE
jgi:hypothetical protein